VAACSRAVRGSLVLLHDNGQMHHGPDLRAVEHRFPRLTLEPLPRYAPELNPVEGLWNHAKDKELANFVPRGTDQLHDAVCGCLCDVRRDQRRLRSFFHATPLSWCGTLLK
jgi:transposase